MASDWPRTFFTARLFLFSIYISWRVSKQLTTNNTAGRGAFDFFAKYAYAIRQLAQDLIYVYWVQESCIQFYISQTPYGCVILIYILCRI